MNKRAFTLIEVVVSLAMFAIISVGFYGMFATVFVNTYKSSEITEATFMSQKQIEDKILETKERIRLNQTVTEFDKVSYTLFEGTSQERTVAGYQLSIGLNQESTIQTIVSETRTPELKVPVLSNFEITSHYLNNGNLVKTNQPNSAMGVLNIGVDGVLQVDNPGIHVANVYYWYVSNRSTYLTGDGLRFPDDYELMLGQTNSSISVNALDYKGKAFVLMVTPVGEKGKMGVSVVSNRIYVSPFTAVDSLLLRLDASNIDRGDSNQVSGNSEVLRWIMNQPSGLINTDVSANPLIYLDYSHLDTGDRLFKVVTNKKDNINSYKSGTPASSATSNVLSVYVVLRVPKDIEVNRNIVQGGGTSGNNRWTLSFQNNNLRATRRSSSDFHVTTSNLNLADEKFKVVKVLFSSNGTTSINVNKVNVASSRNSSFTNSLNSFPITITAGDGVEIAEVLVYSTNVSSTMESVIYTYFEEKYLIDY